jgi:putative transposase
MTTLQPQYPLTVLCCLLKVSISGYYAWTKRRPSMYAQEREQLEVAIQTAHVGTGRTYGPERLRDELKNDIFTASTGQIKRLRKKFCLRCFVEPTGWW